MKEPVRVRMAEYYVGKSPEVIITIGLGSCIGIALYDNITKIGGLIHIMLPKNKKGLKPTKYADTGIPYLINKMLKTGAMKNNITAKIAGGASMFSSAGDLNIQVGQRNIEAVFESLKENSIEIVGEDLGEDYGRTMIFDTVDGNVLIRSYKKGEKNL
ncbi:MAG: chemotaxis protein CheD [Bacillota bacterium]